MKQNIHFNCYLLLLLEFVYSNTLKCYMHLRAMWTFISRRLWNFILSVIQVLGLCVSHFAENDSFLLTLETLQETTIIMLIITGNNCKCIWLSVTDGSNLMFIVMICQAEFSRLFTFSKMLCNYWEMHRDAASSQQPFEHFFFEESALQQFFFFFLIKWNIINA